MKEIGARLIFAPLIRVSTETQKKRGESLNTQRKQLESAIYSLGGEVYHWYAGQEHATSEQERKILDDLLHKAQEGKFNAVIVCDTSRWSRDNKRSKEDLEMLKRNGIKFFVGTTEYNLYNPTHSFMLGVGVEIAEFHAREQSYKSIINRIARAEKGQPSCGKLPYGRKYDEKKNQWSIDKELKEKTEKAAHIYLEEDIGFNELGRRFGMNGTNLRKILIERSGVIWRQRFRLKSANIDKTIQINIPPLLEEEVISKIKEKSVARRTFAHGSYKYDYLLSRIIFDSKTRHALTGTPNSAGQRYYKPYQGSMAPRYMVNADVIESAFMKGLNELFINRNMFHKAVFDGKPIENIADELKDKKEKIKKDIKAKKASNSNLITAIGNLKGDDLTNFTEQVKEKIEKNEKDIKENEYELNIIDNQLNTLPTKKEIEDKMAMLERELIKRGNESFLRSGLAIENLSFSEKKKIINLLFGGQDNNGNKYGIYITPLEGKLRKYRFKAIGRIGCIDGLLNAKDKQYSSHSKTNNHDQDVILNETAEIILDANPYLNVKEDMLGKRHAYYGVCIHQR
jgi:DNA invertase Pin-like site-specific DNA recombinase